MVNLPFSGDERGSPRHKNSFAYCVRHRQQPSLSPDTFYLARLAFTVVKTVVLVVLLARGPISKDFAIYFGERQRKKNIGVPIASFFQFHSSRMPIRPLNSCFCLIIFIVIFHYKPLLARGPISKGFAIYFRKSQSNANILVCRLLLFSSFTAHVCLSDRYTSRFCLIIFYFKISSAWQFENIFIK